MIQVRKYWERKHFGKIKWEGGEGKDGTDK
jgi:hypothetical protein